MTEVAAQPTRPAVHRRALGEPRSGATFESSTRPTPATRRAVPGGDRRRTWRWPSAPRTWRARGGGGRRHPSAARSCTASAALLAEHKERLARAMTREMGKVLAEARGDVQEGIDIAYLMAGEGRRMFGDTVPSELPDKWAMSIRQPIGVAGIITPWNFPIAIPCWKMMPALVGGNTVVFKPARDAPLCATLLVELLDEAGFPPGVVNLVTGSGDEVGDAIVDSPDVRVISFTGHRRPARRSRERAGRRLKRVSLELGGKNARRRDGRRGPRPRGRRDPVVRVRHDRPALHRVPRVIVDRRSPTSSSQRLETRARALRLGSGLDETVDVGPLINERRRRQGRSATSASAEARASSSSAAAGRRTATSRTATSSSRRSSTGSRRWRRIAQEEIFGPVLSVIPVDGYDEAVSAVNGSATACRRRSSPAT